MIAPVNPALSKALHRASSVPALAVVLAVAMLWASGAGARAQDNDQDNNEAILKPAARDDATLIREKGADVLTRIALMRLRAADDPTREDLRAAALALRVARRLAPDDPELLRLEIEAWTTAGDEDETLALSRELLSLDPTDEVAQLRVAIAGIEGLQDVDARLRAYDRVLGPRGAAIDDGVRSRLALDAAMLARDNGDNQAFLKYLTSAMSLDPTNKAAAALFGSHVLGESNDPLERVEVLCNIVLADPMDANAYENLALELLSRGAYAGAMRAFALGTQIALARGWTMTSERVFDFALCEWRVKGPAAAVNRVNKVLLDSQSLEQQRRQAALAEGLDPGPERPLFLPPELSLMLLSIAVSQQNEAGVKAVLDSFLTADDLQVQQIQAHAGSTPEEQWRARVAIETLKLQRLWALLFARQRPDEARELFEEIVADSAPVEPPKGDGSSGAASGSAGDDGRVLSADEKAMMAGGLKLGRNGLPALDPKVIQRFRGWLAMVEGNDREAEELLAPLVEEDSNARWAMGVLRQQQGNEREAMKHFAILAKDNPRSALSTAAWSRLVIMRNAIVAPPPEAQQLDNYIINFAPWLNDLAADPSSFMALRIEHEEDVVDPLGSIKVDVTVRNVSGWPLAIGADRSIPKRLMLAPRLRLKGQDASDLVGPSVALFQNRLRLEPAEEVTVVVTPTRDLLGTILDFTPGAVASLRWQGIQGFVKSKNPGFEAGSMTVTTLSDVVVRSPVDDSVETTELVSRIGSQEGAQLLRTIEVARRRIADAKGEEHTDPKTAQVLTTAIIDRLPSMDPTSQTIVLGWFGESGIASDGEAGRALRAAMANPAPGPAVALLLGFVRDPDDPLLGSLIASDDEALSRMAFEWRERLRAEKAKAAQADGSAPASGP